MRIGDKRLFSLTMMFVGDYSLYHLFVLSLTQFSGCLVEVVMDLFVCSWALQATPSMLQEVIEIKYLIGGTY